MVVTSVPVHWSPRPWDADRRTIAYVVAGPEPGQLALLRADDARPRLFSSLSRLLEAETARGTRDLSFLRRAMPDQGTSIRLGPPVRHDGDFHSTLADLRDSLR